MTSERNPATSFDQPSPEGRGDTRLDLLLVCSSGGHLLQLVALREMWVDFGRAWVTFDKADARSLLHDERVVFAYGPTNRSFGLPAIRNSFRNLLLAWKVHRDLRPRVLMTTGAGVAVPFAWVAWLRGSSVVYVESLTRIDAPSLSCRLIAPVADHVYGQWPEFARNVRRAKFVGRVMTVK